MQTQERNSQKKKIVLPPSIMKKAERAAKIARMPVEVFAKLYVLEAMKEDMAEHKKRTGGGMTSPDPQRAA